MENRSSSTSATRIKVCGIREPDEAAALDALGIDWIGFNFHPASARYIAPEAAAPIIRSLKRSVPVGVFVDAPAARVAEVAAITGIRMAQLHGSENWESIRAMPIPVIKALPHTRLADLAGLRAHLPAAPRAAGSGRRGADSGLLGADSALAPLAYLMVDTQAKPAAASGISGADDSGAAGFGGSGQVFDWNLLAAHPLPLPFFLAGGLGPHNLAAAVAAASPFAVDLNSKVEIAPGRKDLAKIAACLEILGRAA